MRGKFVYDPEHGGGRRRRDKRHPEQKRFTDNDDKLTYNNKDLNKCFELSDDEEDKLRNPFSMAQQTDRTNTNAEQTEINFLASRGCAGAGDSHPENIIEDEDEDENGDDEIAIAPELYYSADGEAHQLPCYESAHSDHGLQNAITADTMNQLLLHKAKCESQGTQLPNIMILDCRFDYEFDGGHINGAINVSTEEEMQELLLGSKDKI